MSCYADNLATVIVRTAQHLPDYRFIDRASLRTQIYLDANGAAENLHEFGRHSIVVQLRRILDAEKNNVENPNAGKPDLQQIKI